MTPEHKKYLLQILGILAGAAWDYISWRKANSENPNAKYDWTLLVARIILGLAGGTAGGEVAVAA